MGWNPQWRVAGDPVQPDGQDLALSTPTPPPTSPMPPTPYGPAGQPDPTPQPRLPGYPLGPMRSAYPPIVPAPTPLYGAYQQPFPAVWPQLTPPSPAPPPAGASAAGWETSSLGMGAAHAAALSYSVWWLSGLLVYFSERQSRFVRFHAFQSIVYTGVLTIASVLGYVVSSLLMDGYLVTRHPVYQTLARGMALLTFFTVLSAWAVPMLGAMFGWLVRIPFIAPYAERYAAPAEPDVPPAIGRG
jgi:uncharacterized membrane protein